MNRKIEDKLKKQITDSIDKKMEEFDEEVFYELSNIDKLRRVNSWGIIFLAVVMCGSLVGWNFHQADKMELPRKVWTECYRCPKFPDCGEVALIYQQGEQA